MNSRDIAHEEDRAALASLERRPWLVIAVAIVALIAVSALVYGIVNQHTTQQVRQLTKQAQQAAATALGYAQADCGSWHDLAVIAPSPTANESGLKLWAGFIDSYRNKGCVAITGQLPAPDPRLLPYLKTK